MGGDVAGIGDVVGAERDAFFPAGEGGGDEFLELRNGIFRGEERLVAHQLGEVVAWVFLVVEGNAEAPRVDVGRAGEDFFTEGFGAAVERAVVGTERKIRCVRLAEAGAVGTGAGVDAARGNVSPRDASVGAGGGDDARKDAVAEEAFRAVEFAGVDVGLAGVAGGVDEKLGPVAEEGVAEGGGVGVIHVGAAQIAKGDAFAREQRLISLADVTGTTEQINHRGNKQRGAGRGNKGFLGRRAKAAARLRRCAARDDEGGKEKPPFLGRDGGWKLRRRRKRVARPRWPLEFQLGAEL